MISNLRLIIKFRKIWTTDVHSLDSTYVGGGKGEHQLGAKEFHPFQIISTKDWPKKQARFSLIKFQISRFWAYWLTALCVIMLAAEIFLFTITKQIKFQEEVLMFKVLLDTQRPIHSHAAEFWSDLIFMISACWAFHDVLWAFHDEFHWKSIVGKLKNW